MAQVILTPPASERNGIDPLSSVCRSTHDRCAYVCGSYREWTTTAVQAGWCGCACNTTAPVMSRLIQVSVGIISTCPPEIHTPVLLSLLVTPIFLLCSGQ